ncbi:imidazolonepropionase [Mesohalobacter halotolerans]|uniref:Imidazolonepropionase n=1 Tax=Mesohalobacter halotolerans TaxID=1883405 RepID=A0A4U5TQC2_9FLAO|nr:imidazolonepropionase [Mesohalobacter halotolerans]MBS3738954.1 imidazolonepropionase [Psychroflexus sp.]TKS56379.1 imidazolonepropionase [Mesohalobacter halotolerans]
MKTHFINIKNLLQVRQSDDLIVSGPQMAVLPQIENAYLSLENGNIVDYGQMAKFNFSNQDRCIDVEGKIILPTWVDSHTHLVYAGTREDEFKDRIKGLSYQEIAEKGGGILNSAEKLQNASKDELFDQSFKRLQNLIQLGTGAIEIKSGYGLTHEGEIKMLEVIQKLKRHSPIPVKATYLAAHALPIAYKNNKRAYIDEIINKTLPEVVKRNLADYVDVFCEKGYFDLADTERILKAAKTLGLKAKIHVNQFNAFGGVQKAVDFDALSVDHLEELIEDDISALQASKTLPVALPGCSFFLGIPYTAARKLIDNNLALTLASDYNPGSAPSGNMNFIVALACIKMNMTPEEAINAATLNAAHAIELSDTLGSICKGKKANFMITKPINSFSFIPYAFGENHIEQVWINGKNITS